MWLAFNELKFKDIVIMGNKRMFGFMLLLILSACNSIKKIENENKTSIFKPNALNADQNYFTKAVLEYHLINAIQKKYGNVYSDTLIPNDPSNTTNDLINLMELKYPNPSKYRDTISCNYKIPTELLDLTSGFQYRYYLFSGTSKASLQAFGITDVNTDSETQYLIIDYLQYKDCKCANLPNIRYAVGLRSELKISNKSSMVDISGVGNLADLAAEVQLDKTEVNFSLKTIGITGYESRLNIPQGVSFDVTTYKDFQNAIEFLKERLDSTENLIIHPEIIPILDDYRPNFRNTIYSLTEEIISLSKMKSKIERHRKISDDVESKLISHIDQEINDLIMYRIELEEINDKLWSIKKYDRIMRDLSSTEEKVIDQISILQSDTAFNDIFNNTYLFSEYKNLKSLDSGLKGELENIYFRSDGITQEGYFSFLSNIDSLLITDDDLKWIIKELKSRQNPNNYLLNSIYLELKSKKE